MSQFVKEILNDIYQRKDTWEKTQKGYVYDTAIKKANIVVGDIGNCILLSVAEVWIDEVRIPVTYIDRIRLERAVIWWYKNVSVFRLTDTRNEICVLSDAVKMGINGKN